MLVEGVWKENWQPVQAKDDKGGFVRQTSTFRNWVTPDGSAGPTGTGGFEAEKGRYHLFVALICPWASRTLIGRSLKGLTNVISVSVVEPELSDQGWRFETAEPLTGASYMHEIYTQADPKISGRATVPVLWDKQTNTIVNNESADILRMMNDGFGTLANDRDLYPERLRAEIDALNAWIYPEFNNGVYRAGFATTQEAYDEAYEDVFRAFDKLERRLQERAFLTGDILTDADVRLFVTLVRFDVAYHGLFKCNKRRIADSPALAAYMDRILAESGVRETVNVEHIKRGYYSVKALNPTGIVPLGPDLPRSLKAL